MARQIQRYCIDPFGCELVPDKGGLLVRWKDVAPILVAREMKMQKTTGYKAASQTDKNLRQEAIEASNSAEVKPVTGGSPEYREHNSAMLEIALIFRACLEGRGVGSPLRDNHDTVQRIDAVIARLQQWK